MVVGGMIIEGGMVKHLFLLDSRWLEDESGFMRWFTSTQPLIASELGGESLRKMLQFNFSYIRYSAVLACRIFDRRELEQV